MPKAKKLAPIDEAFDNLAATIRVLTPVSAVKFEDMEEYDQAEIVVAIGTGSTFTYYVRDEDGINHIESVNDWLHDYFCKQMQDLGYSRDAAQDEMSSREDLVFLPVIEDHLDAVRREYL